MHLAEVGEPAGAHLENLVLHDLLPWRDARFDRGELGYRRTSIGEEVDFVVEAGGKQLHTGSTIEWLVPDALAAPWWAVL